MDSGGLMEQLLERMRPFVSVDAPELSDGVRRDRRWLYPIEALREALVNAFAHRDWTRVEDVEVVRYANRLEIKSPGALPNSMTVEKMLAGQRSARNPLIVEVLRDYGYVDARGMGVRTKIVPLLKQYNGMPPDLDPTEDYLMRQDVPRSNRRCVSVTFGRHLKICFEPRKTRMNTEMYLLNGWRNQSSVCSVYSVVKTI